MLDQIIQFIQGKHVCLQVTTTLQGKGPKEPKGSPPQGLIAEHTGCFLSASLYVSKRGAY